MQNLSLTGTVGEDLPKPLDQVHPRRRIRILQTDCSLNWGGQEKRSIEELFWLRENGYEAWLACNPKSEIYRRRERFGNVSEYIVAFDFSKSWNLLTTLRLAAFIRKNQIDLIHTHGSRDSWICFPFHLSGKSVVRSKHAMPGDDWTWRKTFLYKWGCRRIIVTAESIRRLLTEKGVRKSRIHLVGEGVSLKKFSPQISGSKFRERWEIPANIPLVGVVGMMRGEKGHLTFIQAAFKTLLREPNLRFAIIGEGVGNRSYEIRCKSSVMEQVDQFRKGSRNPFIFTGYCEDVAEAIAALDVVVVPSHSDGQTKVVPEAFACGKPVIASNVGGLPELVQHEQNGILVPPGNPDELSDAIFKLVRDPSLRNKLGREGLKTAQSRLSFDQKMKDLVRVYHGAVPFKLNSMVEESITMPIPV